MSQAWRFAAAISLLSLVPDAGASAGPPPGDQVAASRPTSPVLASAPAADNGVFFTSGFEEGFKDWTIRHQGIFSIVDDPAFAHSGRACAMATATRGKDNGGEIVWQIPEGRDQVFLRFYCRFAKDTAWPH